LHDRNLQTCKMRSTKGGALLTVLVVEDFAPFRQLLCKMLRTNPQVKFITEVGDGLQAVAKARELQPDLILSDIGLPGLNGIEAARQMKRLSPRTKLIFVSQESDVDVVREAFGAGASGYVVKSDVAGELLAALEAVLAGKHFVGRRFANQNFVGPAEGLIPQPTIPKGSPNLHSRSLHEVVFYSDQTSFLETLTQFLGSALRAGDAAVVIVTNSTRQPLLYRLQAMGLDVPALIEEGRYISLDPAQVLAAFMIEGLPERNRFQKLASEIIQTAAKALRGEHARVVICGEATRLLLSQSNAEAALKLEQLWTEIAQSNPIHILCPYSLACFEGEVGQDVQERVRHEHSAVYSR
jgi:DNA-binding NarL/FixJ family response regulator